jgi:hypothetical protein
MRIKKRITVTLSTHQLRILDSYGFRNKSTWIGNRIEEWYVQNINELEKVRNKIRWVQIQKLELEDELKFLAVKKDKLEAEVSGQVTAQIQVLVTKKR